MEGSVSMTGGRQRWADVQEALLHDPATRIGYESARQAFLIGEKVRRARESRGISQAELARRMGTTQPAIARLEAGGVDPRLDTLRRLGEALGVELVVEFRIAANA